ncbi:unnamed protein product [Brassica oleracea var. botrytis]|uniref:Uncharacterized protein n=1 Tax=Brassica oleracea TaxID=3712 RepID=A0A3P6FJF9_BRAOL|nr:unnamed protein product [Brassica oleracea]
MKACVILMLVICAAVIVEQSEAGRDPPAWIGPAEEMLVNGVDVVDADCFANCAGKNPPPECIPADIIIPVPDKEDRRGCKKKYRCRGGE